MKNKLILSIILCFPLFWTACDDKGVPQEVTDQIESVRQAYAPDKRVAIFNVEVKKGPDGLLLEGETNMPEAKAEVGEKLKAAGFEVNNQVRLLPAEELDGKTYGVVRLSVCNIRSAAGHSEELATQATLGTPLRVYKKEGNWFLVQTPDQYLGWLDAGGFEPMDKAAYGQWMQAGKIVYLPEFGFSKQAPQEGSLPVSDLLAGNILKLDGTEGNYAKVSYPDGRTAYLPATEVMNYQLWLASRQPSVDNIIREAFNFLGRPYLWGGTSGKGVDCSGFTKSVFFLNGMLLPRDASQQVFTGEEIPTDTTLTGLLAGDLLFFGRKATDDQKEKITHVAIYLGDGKIIHSSGIVKVESLRRGDPDFTAHRLETFVRAKRILQSVGKNGVQLLTDSEYY